MKKFLEHKIETVEAIYFHVRDMQEVHINVLLFIFLKDREKPIIHEFRHRGNYLDKVLEDMRAITDHDRLQSFIFKGYRGEVLIVRKESIAYFEDAKDYSCIHLNSGKELYVERELLVSIQKDCKRRETLYNEIRFFEFYRRTIKIRAKARVKYLIGYTND